MADVTRSNWATNDARFGPATSTDRAVRRHDHIDYTRGHCTFRYDDGHRCVWVGELLDGMCVDHRYITKLRENARRGYARRREQGEGG